MTLYNILFSHFFSNVQFSFFSYKKFILLNLYFFTLNIFIYILAFRTINDPKKNTAFAFVDIRIIEFLLVYYTLAQIVNDQEYLLPISSVRNCDKVIKISVKYEQQQLTNCVLYQWKKAWNVSIWILLKTSTEIENMTWKRQSEMAWICKYLPI